MMKVYIITPFPKIISSVLGTTMLAKAEERGKVEYHILNLFEFLDNENDRIDDYPFGGEEGMILKVEPLTNAIESIIDRDVLTRIIFPTPDGKQFNHSIAKELSNEDSLTFICGHYKGIDQRVRDRYVSDELSIGDFILTSGELPTMLMMDSIIRLKKGVLNNYNSAKRDSFYNVLLDGPHYTRPRNFREVSVPEVLLSGNHKKIEEWFLKKREEKTKKRRIDLWKKYRSFNNDGVENG